MTKKTGQNKYKWDVAISLCKEDIEFAKRLVKAINPAIKVFFYSDRQEDLISKSGPEEFAKTFKEESRIVVILSQDEWSKSFYTEIERNAIMDRTKNEGYRFIMVLPMKPGEIPPWYPSTQIYASAERFSVEELARFIEFKVADEGGVIKELTLEDRYQNFLERIEQKKSLVKLQRQPNSIECAQTEMETLKNLFNEKLKFLNQTIFDRTATYLFSTYVNYSYIGIGNYLLECRFTLPDTMYDQIVTAQDFWVTFELSQTFGDLNNKKLLETEHRVFYYTQELHGWAKPHIYEQPTDKEIQVLYRNGRQPKFYDLINIIRTSSLVDTWYQKLLSLSSQKIDRYL